jgi:hypothetical protein
MMIYAIAKYSGAIMKQIVYRQCLNRTIKNDILNYYIQSLLVTVYVDDGRVKYAFDLPIILSDQIV